MYYTFRERRRGSESITTAIRKNDQELRGTSGSTYRNFTAIGGRKAMSIDVGLIFQIAGIGIVLAFIHTVLKELKREDIANWVILVGFVVILFHVAFLINTLFDKIKSVFLFQ